MEIRKFRDEFEQVAPLHGLTAAELRERMRDRWIAIEDSRVVASAEALLRPDHRLLLTFRGDEAAAPALADAAARSLACPVWAFADEDTDLAATLRDGGFAIELTLERFVVPFDRSLRLVHRSTVPRRYRLLRALDCNPDRLFHLDNAVRRLVPGSDGWQGNRTWFDDELTDPASYWVAEDRNSGRYVGLARMWRNPTGPRFGLIGVLPEHRWPSAAPALLKATLEEAATWGTDTFTTETALTNRVVHPRLSKLGRSRGRFHQLVLRLGSSDPAPPASGLT